MNRILALLTMLFVVVAVPCFAKSSRGSVSGEVHKNSKDGAGLSGVTVTCGGKSDKTDASGKFKIKDIVAGRHTVSFSKGGYDSFNTEVAVVADKNANLGDRWLSEKRAAPGPAPEPRTPAPPVTGSVSGTLHKNSASGSTLSGAAVSCGGKSTTTDRNGNFKVDGISAGHQTLAIAKEGYSDFKTSISIVSGKNAKLGERWLVETRSQASSTDSDLEKSGPVYFPSLKRVAYPGPANRQYCYPQCVDFVRDALSPKLHHTGDAKTFWTDPPAGYKRYANGSARPPIAGDILVWRPSKANGYNGHVALVKAVDVSREELERTDANYSSDYLHDCNIRNHQMKLTKEDGKYTVVGGDVYGWLSKD